MNVPTSDTNASPAAPRRGILWQFYELLSSMRFAISLLTILAIASIVGTVLKQNEPYNNYLDQFGQFWFPVFDQLGLYAVYNAPWFLVILAFLVLSTSLCILRQTPHMLKEMKSHREHAQELSLRQFAHHAEFRAAGDPQALARSVTAYLHAEKFSTRTNRRDDGILVAAKTGSHSRLGYFLAHGAIVLICVGGLLDGNLPLKLQMWSGHKHITQGNVPMAKIPPSARLGTDNFSYRGNVFVPEGKSQDVAVLNVRDGILVQDLPFSISLKKFTIDFYTTGAPKRFASDVILTDKATGKSFEHTIEVNKPLTFKGVAIYQASFDDGGSVLHMRAHSLLPGTHDVLPVDGEVGEAVRLSDPRYRHTVELTAFRPINVENMIAGTPERPFLDRLKGQLGSAAGNKEQKDLRNIGPSFTYKLRDEAGQAREYINYMLPVEQQGRAWLITGMRETPQQPFRFLRMPVDETGKIDTFLDIRARLLDPAERSRIARRFATDALQREADGAKLIPELTQTAEHTLELFQRKGFASMADFLEKNIPEPQREKAAEVFLKVLQGCTWDAWMLERESRGLAPLELTRERDGFVHAVLDASSDSLFYGAPLYLELADFKEVKASVFQVTRSPGKPIVFLGSALLVAGVLFMLYVRERRLFVLLKNDGSALLAMSANRRTLDFDAAFEHQRRQFARLLGDAPGETWPD